MNGRRIGHAGIFTLDCQRLQVGFFNAPPTRAIDQQAPRRGRQKGSRLLDVLRLGQHQDANKRIMGQVRSLLRAPEFFAQPTVQPAMVFAVHRRKGLLTHWIAQRGRNVMHAQKLLKWEILPIARTMPVKRYGSKG